MGIEQDNELRVRVEPLRAQEGAELPTALRNARIRGRVREQLTYCRNPRREGQLSGLMRLGQEVKALLRAVKTNAIGSTPPVESSLKGGLQRMS